MNVTRVQSFITVVAASAFLFAASSVFAQTHRPIGSPVSPNSHQMSIPNGQLPTRTPQLPRLGGVPTFHSYEGIDFNDSNCGCLPPDTNASVGNGFIVEPVNVQIRVFDAASGAILLDEPLQTFFGAPSGGDPYVVYDDIANRWYVSAFDSSDSGLFLAVSNDGNPLHGFTTYDLTNVGGFPDYNKLGFNKDAVFDVFNNFGPGGDAGATVASIDKAQLLSGHLVYFVHEPAFQFRAMPPAQLHGDTTGGVEWFMSTDGTDAGGNSIRITKVTNYLSNSPNFTYYHMPVTQYQSATTADQPGGPGSVTTFPNTTFYETQYRNGRLVGAMSSGQAPDGFTYPKGLYYEVLIKGVPTPIMLRNGIIDAGPGVAEQMASVDEDSAGNLGFSWIESSSSEFVSMWVGSRYVIDTNNATHASVAAPGLSFMVDGFRIGDYSTTVLDPSDSTLFWSANEYVGANGGSDIWNTHITGFRAK